MPHCRVAGKTSPNAEAALTSTVALMSSIAIFKSIREVRTQVVSGINYDIEFILNNGEIWNTRIYRDLAGNYKMIKAVTKGELSMWPCIKGE